MYYFRIYENSLLDDKLSRGNHRMKAPWTEVSISRVLGKIFPFSVNDFSYITGPRTAKAKYILIKYIKIVIV